MIQTPYFRMAGPYFGLDSSVAAFSAAQSRNAVSCWAISRRIGGSVIRMAPAPALLLYPRVIEPPPNPPGALYDRKFSLRKCQKEWRDTWSFCQRAKNLQASSFQSDIYPFDML